MEIKKSNVMSFATCYGVAYVTYSTGRVVGGKGKKVLKLTTDDIRAELAKDLSPDMVWVYRSCRRTFSNLGATDDVHDAADQGDGGV